MTVPLSKRLEWVYHFLKTGSEGQANKLAMTGRGYRARLVRHIEATGSLDDKPRSGRPPEYSVPAMEEALRLLKAHEDDLLTMKDLHRLLVSKGILKERSTTKTFSQHFKSCVASLGHRLTVNSTSTLPFLRATDKPERVKYCKAMLAVLKYRPLEDFWFVDETTVEESPHPKGAQPHCRGHTSATSVPCPQHLCYARHRRVPMEVPG